MNRTTTAELKELQELIAAGRAPKPARDGEIKWHPKISGLGLRLYNSGNGTWVVQYRNENGRTKRHKGGNAAVTNLRFAEDWGKRVLRQVGGGEDPQDTRESARTKPSLTLRRLIDLYFEAQVVLIAHRAQSALSPKTLYTYRQLAKHHLVELAQLQADEITPKQITKRIKAVDQNGKHPALAQHFRAMLGSVYRWAMDDPEFDIDANPVKASWRPMTKEQSGEALTMEELGAIWRACEKLATVPPRFKGNALGALAPVAAKSVRADDTLISLREAERQIGITKPILDRAVKAGELKVILRRDLRTPEDPIKIKQGYHRRTYLVTAGELRRFAATRSPLMRSPQFEYSIIIRLLILLGGRYSEMGGLRWSELEKLDAGILHIKTKTAEGHRRIKSKRGKKKDLTIYLPQVAIDLIKSVPETPGRDCLFGNGRTELTSTGKGTGLLQNHWLKMQLDELIAEIDGAPLRKWKVHWLRHTFTTHLNELGEDPRIIEAATNHLTAEQISAMHSRYNHARYAKSMREMLTRWAQRVRNAAGGVETIDNASDDSTVIDATPMLASGGRK